MIKISKRIKKILAILLLTITIVSSLNINAFAAFITDINSDATFRKVPGTKEKYGYDLQEVNYSGQTYLLFCCQYMKKSAQGTFSYNNDFQIQFNNQRQEYKKIAEYIYFGYTMKYGMGIPNSIEAERAACATQQFVWEYIRDHIDSSYGAPARDKWKSTYMSSAIYSSWLNETETYYNLYHNSNVSFNGQTSSITIGDRQMFTDTNGVLASYPSFEKIINGITFSHTQGENNMLVTVNGDCNVSTVNFSTNKYDIYRLMPNGKSYSKGEMSNYMYFHFTDSKLQNVIFSNYVDPSFFNFNIKVENGKITIIKNDSETGAKKQGDATFEGAEYSVYAQEDIYNHNRTRKIYSKNELVATRIMNKDGATEEISKLPFGRYMVKETKSPEGYLLDEKEYEVDLKENNANVTITSKEDAKKMQIHIFKSGININSGMVPGLANVEFTIKLYSEVEMALNKGYSYSEIWNGIDENGNRVKVDSNRVAQAQKIAPTYSILTTDIDGNAYTENGLAYGKYIVKETNTPKDFQTSSDFTFSITKDESEVKELAKKVKHLYVNNEQMEAYIKLMKKDADSEKVISLNSATFQIIASKDIVDRGNGKILYKKGEIITQKIGSSIYNAFTTNSENLIIADGNYNNIENDKGTVVTPLKLPVGEYEVTEIKIPTGYLKLENPVKFKIDAIKDYDKDSTGEYIKTVEVKNEKPFGTVVIDKTIALKEEVDTSLVNIDDLSGIKFRLNAKENIIDLADGSIIYKKGQEVGNYNLDKNGKLIIERLPMGDYEIQEIETLEGLVLDQTKYEIKFIQNNDITKIYTNNLHITNNTTLVEISKKTITGDEELPGAELTVIDENGKVIDNWISSDKPHTIEGLVVGKEYTLKENLAPLGYSIASEIKFKVSNTNETQKIVMVDMPILSNIKIIKIDENTKEIIKKDFIFGLYADEECTQLISEVHSDKKEGTVLFENLKYGEYYIKEIKSPKGYELSNKVVKLKINEDGVFANETKLTQEDNVYSFEFTNKQTPKIQTGNRTNYVLVTSCIIISIVGITIGVILLKKKNN